MIKKEQDEKNYHTHFFLTPSCACPRIFIGLPDNLDFKNTKSLGLQLVTGLVRQLQGNIDVERTTCTKFTIIF